MSAKIPKLTSQRYPQVCNMIQDELISIGFTRKCHPAVLTINDINPDGYAVVAFFIANPDGNLVGNRPCSILYDTINNKLIPHSLTMEFSRIRWRGEHNDPIWYEYGIQQATEHKPLMTPKELLDTCPDETPVYMPYWYGWVYGTLSPAIGHCNRKVEQPINQEQYQYTGLQYLRRKTRQDGCEFTVSDMQDNLLVTIWTDSKLDALAYKIGTNGRKASMKPGEFDLRCTTPTARKRLAKLANQVVL